MASIEKRGKSYRATVSLYRNGKYTRITKTDRDKSVVEQWALEKELEKGNGHDLAKRSTPFAVFFKNWVYAVKKNDVREATFQNYTRAVVTVEKLFKDIPLKNLNDIVVQSRINEFGETHARRTTTELLLKIRISLRYAYARGLISKDFASLVKTRGKDSEKRNRALSITDMKELRRYLLNNYTEFNVLVLLALETGGRRGELLGLRPSDLYKYGVKICRSISSTSSDTSLKTKGSRRDISINKEVYELLVQVPVKENGYIFAWGDFHQSARLKRLLKKIGISTTTTFHGLRDTHASFLFSQEIGLDYISKRLGHESVLTTQNYYLELMPEKKHKQDAVALDLLSSLSD